MKPEPQPLPSIKVEKDSTQQSTQPSAQPPNHDSQSIPNPTVNESSDNIQKKTAPPIVYDLPPSSTAENAHQSLVASTKSKFAQRAARFGADTRPVRDVDVVGSRRASVRQGFATGFDIHTDEQQRLRALRAKRFGPPVPADDKPNVEPQSVENPLPVKSDPLERRRDVAVGELPRENVLHVFGVDDMSTRDILAHFRPYGPCWCEWLNDSSVNIAFEDTYTLKRALSKVAPNKVDSAAPEDRMDDGEGAGASMAVAGEGVLPDELVWRPTESFKKGLVAVPLWVRQATERDRRPEMPNPRSKWSRTIRDKKRAERMSRDNGDDGTQDERRSRRGSLGVKSAIQKAREKKVTKMDLDKALET